MPEMSGLETLSEMKEKKSSIHDHGPKSEEEYIWKKPSVPNCRLFNQTSELQTKFIKFKEKS
jgi:hypothetical protein